MPSPLIQHRNLIMQLNQELSKLKSRFQMAHELKVKWLPNANRKKSGEHEFIDYILTTELILPSQKLINKLIALIEEIIYERKERLIEKFLQLLINS
jgi:hypothetical protein